MSATLPAPIDDCFQSAWGLAQAAGLSRPQVQVIPDPVISLHDSRAGWLLARVQAEVVGFQQALGAWSQSPPIQPKALSEALAGLRRGGKGPAWWRQALAPWRQREAARWRLELAEEVHRLRRSSLEVAQVLQAHRLIRQGLDRWSQWADGTLPSPVRDHWESRRAVFNATLGMLEERLTARDRMEQSQLDALQQALALVDMVSGAKGAGESEAWLEAADKASRALREMRG